tara:strand:- start:957 stop:1424 length:468 start_codon:yes stop_codon:yes gene_type:complete
MIKFNVITNNSKWLKYIKNPDRYLNTRINKLNINSKKFIKNKIFCTLLLSGDKEIKKLNKKFRKKNKITDVLSFPFQTKKELRKILKKEKEIYLGDIIVNINKIKNKKEIKDFKIEFDRLWIHGLVHLFGHDHVQNKDYVKMNKIEKKYFDIINV